MFAETESFTSKPMFTIVQNILAAVISFYGCISCLVLVVTFTEFPHKSVDALLKQLHLVSFFMEDYAACLFTFT